MWSVPGFGIGAAVLRKEDARLLAGRGSFVDDIRSAGALWCHFVRSPHAHARIRSIDAAEALRAPGVVAVLTGRDLAADGVRPMRCLWPLPGMVEPERWPLAMDTARYVGEAVAVVMAESAALAADAADEVRVEYEALPASVDAQTSASQCLLWERGDAAAVDAAFAAAAHVVKARLESPRLAGAAIEPRALIARWEEGALTLWSATQVPHHVRRQVSEELGLAEPQVRVIAPDVGGGFGYKGKHYPEETVLAWAAKRLQGAVRWTASRNESFLADLQGRGHVTEAELALDAGGRFLALRVATVADVGAYVSSFGAAIPTAIYGSLLAGVYRTPAIRLSVRCVFTHRVPTDAYRGAGRPEACCVLERLADLAAEATGLDRAEVRRRNLVPASAMPYRTPLGATYDCGDFPAMLERALAGADYAGFEARRAAGAARGRLRGIGLAVYVESSGVGPSKLSSAMGARVGYEEWAELRMAADGGVTALAGTHSHGQGHATTYSQILTTRLGVSFESIAVVEGDTALVPQGTGTFGSRSIAVGGAALAAAADRLIERGRLVASELLEAAAADIVFARGEFSVAGTDRRAGWTDVARQAGGLAEDAVFDPVNFAWSNGCHVAEVEVDPETGCVEVVRYTAFDDFGTVINPMIVHGQVHGGIAQGAGQALLERVAADPQGQVLSASFLDYALPRADDLPGFEVGTDESQPFPGNALGAKGCGESGAVGAPAAIASAVRHALGGRDIAMPFSPEAVWRVASLPGR